MTKGKSSSKVGSPYIIGFLIAGFYVAFLALLFIGFSAYITRTNFDVSGEVVTPIDVLIYTNELDLKLDQDIASLKYQLVEFKRKLDHSSTELKSIERDMLFSNSKIQLMIGQKFSAMIRAINIDDDSPLRDFFKAELEKQSGNFGTKFRPYHNIRKQLASFQLRSYSLKDDKDTALKNAEELSNALGTYSQDFADLQSKHAETKTRLTQLEHDQAALKEELFGLREREKAFENRVSLMSKSIISSLELPADILLRFVKMPTIILTLVVTIAAGGLGSLASFTRKFIRQDRRAKHGRLFANIAEGIVASIAIFLFAGTGMLMLTQGGSGQEQAVELSPYMVAFIAFLSGFMAENAFSKIEEAGEKLFKTEDTNGSGQRLPEKVDENQHVEDREPEPQPASG